MNEITGASRRRSRTDGKRVLLAVLLNARRAQAGKAVLVNRGLPGEEFLDGQRIPRAGLFKRQKAPTHGGDHLRLSADDPALGRCRRQIRNRQRTTIGPDHILDPRAMGFVHWYTHKTRLDWQLLRKSYKPRLKICLSMANASGNVCPVSDNLLVTDGPRGPQALTAGNKVRDGYPSSLPLCDQVVGRTIRLILSSV